MVQVDRVDQFPFYPDPNYLGYLSTVRPERALLSKLDACNRVNQLEIAHTEGGIRVYCKELVEECLVLVRHVHDFDMFFFFLAVACSWRCMLRKCFPLGSYRIVFALRSSSSFPPPVAFFCCCDEGF
jgi:hypothetical protein